MAGSDILATLEQRISYIADALQSRPQIDQDMQDLEAVVQRLVEKIERLQILSAEYPNSQLEEHIAKLIEKIESSDARFSQLDKISSPQVAIASGGSGNRAGSSQSSVSRRPQCH